MTPTAAVMSLGWQHHQAGNLGQAEVLYRQVLAAEPRNTDALYLLAMCCQVQGRAAEAVALYQQFLGIKPDVAEVQNSLGVAFATLGRLTEAIACFQQAVFLKPDYAEAFNNLGYVQTSQGDLHQALASLRRALALKPHYPEALNHLGIVHFQQQRLDDAGCCFREALALRPQFVEALNGLGNTLFAQDNLTDAVDCYQRALSLRPNDAKAHNNLGGVYRTLGRWDEAVACLQRSLTFDPNDPKTHRNLGKLFFDRGQYAEALPSYQRVLALCPDDKEARFLVEALSPASSLARVPVDYLAEIYDGFAANFEKALVERRGYRSPELLKAALLAEYSAGGPPARSLEVLDLGCGTGLCGLQVREWARTLIGVDLSPNMLAKARERGLYDELIQSDLLLPVQASENRFDLIVASDVLFYVGDLEPVTRAVHRALRPGGRFAFTVELPQKDAADEAEPDYRLLPLGHFIHSRAYLRRVAALAQLREASATDVEFPREDGQSVPGLVLVLARP
jgi:predicted TPR repeat methyltransferase